MISARATLKAELGFRGNPNTGGTHSISGRSKTSSNPHTTSKTPHRNSKSFPTSERAFDTAFRSAPQPATAEMAYSQQPAGTASRGTFNPAYPHAQPAPSYLDYADPASTARLFPPPAQPVQSAGPAYAAWEHVYKPTEPKDYMESDIHYKDEKPCCGKCCQPGWYVDKLGRSC